MRQNRLFGIEVKRVGRKNAEESDPTGSIIVEKNPALVPENADDGVIESVSGSVGHRITSVDFDDSNEINSNLELIRRYRTISTVPEVDNAINEIVDEAICFDSNDIMPVSLDFHKEQGSPLSEALQTKIEKEWKYICRVMRLADKTNDFFRRWYIDGKIAFQVIADSNNLEKGLEDIRFLDPMSIFKKREIIKKRDEKTGVDVIDKTREYFVYKQEDSMFSIKIAPATVLYVNSGLYDLDLKRPISYLHKAIRPANMLRWVEDALVIYRISRAPERRIFYIGTGNLSTKQSNAYVSEIMNRFKTKLIFESETGEVKSDSKNMALLEDFWLPRKEDGRGTEVSTLQAGSNLGQIEDIVYFQQKLYQSLNLPRGRLEKEDRFVSGRSSEMNREEVRFQKFVSKLRKRFSEVFLQALRIQLILKKVIDEAEWEEIRDYINIRFNKDNHFYEMQQTELLSDRARLISELKREGIIGTYLSHSFVRKHILQQTEAEIKEEDELIKKESTDVRYVTNTGDPAW